LPLMRMDLSSRIQSTPSCLASARRTRSLEEFGWNFENNQLVLARVNFPDNCKIMQFEGFTWPWTSGFEELPLSE
jgi:hypothetical protein